MPSLKEQKTTIPMDNGRNRKIRKPAAKGREQQTKGMGRQPEPAIPIATESKRTGRIGGRNRKIRKPAAKGRGQQTKGMGSQSKTDNTGSDGI